ncbi:polysaccharide deacetylase family protein [Acaryochloris sp. 'Moss Beach']|uniref:polysaccharide deacetylase family protein n=1 Tax=Acaryochloris sp. 'Moss Beach' TaxID=2740837 RepID=UPI001F188641|nr:polysaccharide deacetylase family protein [Acaryochloris sp. 'Moss Beach']UJB68443.1 polysaccharide deacetylase family protein [Acaryochloris sp. 'Moss Beach']
MFGKNLRARVVNRQYVWLASACLCLGVSSFVLQATLNQVSIGGIPEDINALEGNTLIADSESGFHLALKTVDDLDRKQRRHYQPPTQFQGLTIDEVKLPSDQKVIALTFDDGPWPKTTAKMLDILKEHQVEATFFVVGSNITRFPHLLKRVAKEGHAIGNHSWSHGYHYHSPALAQQEIKRTAAEIEKQIGFKTKLFRPPGGYLRNGLVAHARSQKHVTLMWTVDDTYKGTVDKAINNVLNNASPGGIVLMHDGGDNRQLMIQALPHIITRLRQQGYKLVTIPQLLELAKADQNAG